MQIDPDLAEYGDSRNVIDEYKTWTNESISQDLAKRAFPLHIAIENYQHDFNIGTIVRNANAFNVASVHIIGKRRWNRRGAMATEKYLQLFHHADVKEFLSWVKENNLLIMGIDIPGTIELHKTILPNKCVFVFGQEGPGLSKEMKVACKDVIAIKQFGSTRSINVGVASGIIMYQWVQQHYLN